MATVPAFLVRKGSKGTSFPYDAVLEANVTLPQPKADDVVVKISASALNHRDNWITQGAYPGIKEGVVLGSDCVGIIVKAGDASLVGKRVVVDPTIGWPKNMRLSPPGKIAILGMPTNGTFAGALVIPKANIRLAPSFLDDFQAAALPLAGVTAYRSVVTKGKCTSQSLVLVTGVGGGVAVFAVQIAVALGAKVYVTSSSADKINRAVKELGAIRGVNYKNETWPADLLKLTKGAKFDVVIDGAGDIASILRVTTGGGRIVSYGSTMSPSATVTLPQLFLNQIELLGTAMGSPEDFDELLALVNAKKIVPLVDEVFPFERFPDALAKMRKGGQFGKLVLDHKHIQQAKL